MTKETKIKIGYRKGDEINLTANCQRAAHVLRNVQRAANLLGVKVTFAKLLEWQKNPESLKEAYRADTLKGVESLPVLLAQQAREATEAEINRIFDGTDFWGADPNVRACLPFIEWDEEAQSIRVNTEKVKEACTNYVTEETRPIYEDLQNLCKHLNEATKGTCTDDYVTTDAPIKCEGGVWSINDENFDLSILL